MPMESFRNRKLALLVSVAATTVLAAAVFLWGLEYKCSLYSVPSQSLHSVPIAKLLSERERPPQARAADPMRAAFLLASFFSFLLWVLGRARDCRPGLHAIPLRQLRVCHGFRVSSLPPFFSRPPPFFAF